MRSVIVTGASRGLGLGIARALCSDGYRVIAIARTDSDELSSAIREVALASASRGALYFLPFDLANLAEIPGVVSTIRRQFGPIFGLVNNAGTGTSGLLATMRNDDIERLVCLNTLSPVLFTKYVVRSMMANGGGRVVNITSILALNGYSGVSVYSATKASLVGFTRSLARELGRLNINVNAVAPGFVETDMTRGVSDGQRDQIARRSALRHLVEVVDVANAVAFLMSDKARNVTGTVLTVDAGTTA
jgi:3-oxoacyl-[acyl-carrier protein] reductase